jgi:hypothetical protein
LASGERYKDIGCQVCKVLSRTISRRGQLRKSPRKSSRWDLFPEPDCVTSMRWAQLRITFSLRKNNDPRMPQMFCITFYCYHLNPARTRTLSVLPGPSPARARADLYCRSLFNTTVSYPSSVSFIRLLFNHPEFVNMTHRACSRASRFSQQIALPLFCKPLVHWRFFFIYLLRKVRGQQ